jgi:hypothetical protein
LRTEARGRARAPGRPAARRRVRQGAQVGQQAQDGVGVGGVEAEHEDGVALRKKGGGAVETKKNIV